MSFVLPKIARIFLFVSAGVGSRKVCNFEIRKGERCSKWVVLTIPSPVRDQNSGKLAGIC